jgi:hypothetical protein
MMKPATSDDGQARLASLRKPDKGVILQSAAGEELRWRRMLVPSVLDRAFKGELCPPSRPSPKSKVRI